MAQTVMTNEEIATVRTDETTTVCEQLAPEKQPTKPNETKPTDDNKANTSKLKLGFAIADGRYTCKLCKYGTTEIESFRRHMSKEIHGRKRCSGLDCVKCSSLKGLMKAVRRQKLDSPVGDANEDNVITVTESRPAASVANNVFISKTVDFATGSGASATKTGVSAPKSSVSAPKAVESATKTRDSASKTGASAPKTVESSAESIQRSGKSASKTGESASTSGESVNSAAESVAKSGKSASKTGQSASKTGECATKTVKSAPTDDTVEIDDRPFYRCSFPGCNFSCLRDKDFLVHNVATHPSAFSYPCHYCSCLWDSAERIMGHLKSHSSKQSYRCIHCDIMFTSQHAMNTHIENNHQGNTKFCCNHCDFQTMTYTYYKVHYFSAHANAQTHKCFQCGTVVNSMLDMFTHIEKRVSYTYRCTMCKMSSRFKHQVQRHVQVAHSKKTGHFIAYMSFVCKSDESENAKTSSPNIALTSSKQSSATNKQIHTSLGQATPSSSTNVTQMSRHLSTQYMCSWCNYRSESETPVLSHILTCSNSLLNEKQQSKCTRCTFSCQSGSILQQHSRWHLFPQDPLSAFVCSQCPFGSNSYGHFCSHSQYHVLENSATVLKHFRCSHCFYSSNQWNLAMQHISTKHRDVKILTKQSKSCTETKHVSNTETKHVSNTKQVAKPTNSSKAKSSEKADDGYVGFANNDHIHSGPTLRTRQPRNYAEPEIEDTSSTPPTTLTSAATIDRFHCDLCEFGCSDRDQFLQHNLQHQVPVTASAPSESQNQVPMTASAPSDNQNRATVTASAPSEDERQVPVTPSASPKNPNQAPVTPKAPSKDSHQVPVTSSALIENSKSSNQDDDDGDSTYKPDDDDDDGDDDDDYMDDDLSDTDDTNEIPSKADLTYCAINKRSDPDITSDEQLACEEDESAMTALSTEAQTTAVATKAWSVTLSYALAPILVPPTVAIPNMVPMKDARIVVAQSTDPTSILEKALVATNAETSMERSQSAAPPSSLVKIKAEPPDNYEVSSLKKFYKCVYCDFCDEKSITVLREHILLTHLKRKHYWCEWCGYEHMCRDYVTVHHKSHHSNCLLRVGVDKSYNNNIISLESHGDVHLVGVVNDKKVRILELNDGVIVDGRAIGEARKTFDELEEDTHGKKQIVVSDTTAASAVDASEVTTSNVLNKSDLEKRKRRIIKCDLCDHWLKSKAAVDYHRQIHFEYRPYGCCYCCFQANTRGRVMKHCHLVHTELPATHKTIPRPEQISNAEDANTLKRPRLASDGSDVEMTPGCATRSSMARLFKTLPKKVKANEKPAAKKAKSGPASKIGMMKKKTKGKIHTKRAKVTIYQGTLCNGKLQSKSAMCDHLVKELDDKKHICGYGSRSTWPMSLLDEMKKHSVIAHKGLNLSVSKHHDADIEEKLESLLKQSAVTEHGDTEKAHDSVSEQSNDEQQIISNAGSASSPERTLPVPVTSTLSKTSDAPSNTVSATPTNRPIASRKLSSPAVAQPAAQPVDKRISPFCCGFCSYTTFVAAEIQAHMEDHMLHSSRAYECGYCNFAGESYDTVVQHSQKMHVNWPPSVMNNLDTGPNATKLPSAAQTQASQAQLAEQAHQPPANPEQHSQAQPAPESAVVPASSPLQVACVSTDAVVNVSEKLPRKRPTAMKHTAPRNRNRKSATNVVKMQMNADFRCANCSFRTLNLGCGHCRGRHRASEVVTLVDDYFLADATHYDENGVGFCSFRYRCAHCHHAADSRHDVIKHARAQHGSAKIIEKRRWHGQRSAQRPNFQMKLQLTDIVKMPYAKRLSLLRKNGVQRTQI